MKNNRFEGLFAEASGAFKGKYKEELNMLTGLTKTEMSAVTPNTTDLQMYSVLTKVVEQASKDNLSQAELMENIKKLGDLAIKLAKKIPGFYRLL